MIYVYILQHRLDGTLYKGWTRDLRRRLKEHHSKISRTTARKNGNYGLVWFCAFPNIRQAAQFEHYLKSGSGCAFVKRHLLPDTMAVPTEAPAV